MIFSDEAKVLASLGIIGLCMVIIVFLGIRDRRRIAREELARKTVHIPVQIFVKPNVKVVSLKLPTKKLNYEEILLARRILEVGTTNQVFSHAALEWLVEILN